MKNLLHKFTSETSNVFGQSSLPFLRLKKLCFFVFLVGIFSSLLTNVGYGQTASGTWYQPKDYEPITNASYSGVSGGTITTTTAAGTFRTGTTAIQFAPGTTSSKYYWNSAIGVLPAATTGTVHIIYWAKAYAGSATSITTTPSNRYVTSGSTGSGSSDNSGSSVTLSKTAWTQCSSTTTPSNVTRVYFAAPACQLAGASTSSGCYFDDFVVYYDATSATDLTAPSSGPSTLSYSGGSLSWTNGSDAGTGVQGSIILGTNTASPTTPVIGTDILHQGYYANSSTITVGSTTWTVLTNTTSTSYTTSGYTTYAVFNYDKAYNYSSVSTVAAASLLTAPTLSASTGQSVDNNFNITFTDDATWRGGVTGITVDGTSYSAASGAYSLSSGSLILTTSAISELQTAKSHTITVINSAYTVATVTQTNIVGADKKIIVTQQPTAPVTNGASLAQQPKVQIQDQYGNLTASTASVTAAVGAGTWTLGGTTSVSASAGVATFTNLTASSAAAVTGATITFTSGSLTSATSTTFNIPGLTAPSLTAASGATVDASFNITFTDNPSWDAAVTSVKVGGTALPSAAWSLSAGVLTLIPSQSSLLQVKGNLSIAVSATGYADAPVTQAIAAGVAAKLAVTTPLAAPTTNGGAFATQPKVSIEDQYGNVVTGSTANVTAAVGAGTWTLGGTATVAASSSVASFSGLTATATGAVTGATITFTSGVLTSTTSAAFNIPAPTPPALTAASNQTVDNNFNITFTDDAVWRAAVTGITVDGTAYSSSAYTLTAGSLVLTASAIVEMHSAKSHTIVVLATGYTNNTLTKTNIAGTATQLTIGTQPAAPATNGGVLTTQPVIKLLDQYNNSATTSGIVVTATTSGGSWNIGGAVTATSSSSGVATFSGVTAGTSDNSALATATITFTASGLTSVVSNSFAIPVGPQPYTYTTESFETTTTPVTTTWPTSDPGSTLTNAVGVTGTWQLAKAFTQSANGVHSGSSALTENSTSFKLIMPTLNKGAGTLTFWATGTSSRTLTILSSTNGGTSFPTTVGTASIVSGQAITQYSFTINSTTVNGIEFTVSGGSGAFIDDILLTPYQTAPTLSAAANQTVDNNFNITYSDDATWRSAINTIYVDGTGYTSNYTLSAGSLAVNTAAITALHTPGSHTIVVAAVGYANTSVTATTLVGADNKLIVTQQPTAPASNGSTLALQPKVQVLDQYGNPTNSTASITATVGSGTWTIGGTTSVNAVAGVTTFGNLTATSLVSVIGATITFTSGSLTATTSSTFNIPAPLGATPPALTAAVGATVDNNFNITYTDDAGWRGAVNTVLVGTNVLPTSAWSLSAGVLTLKPAQSAFLQSAGTYSITIQATGYNDDIVSQTIAAGVATQLSISTQPVAPAQNGAVLATQPVVQLKDQYGNPTGSGSVVASVSGGSWNLGGTTSVNAIAGTATFSGLTAGTSGGTLLNSATITFTSGALSVTSSAFVIPAYVTSSTDYFRSVASTDWATASTWQSSPNGVTYYAASTAPTATATAVELQSPFNVTMNNSTTVGNVTIDNGATLSMGTSTVLTFTTGKTFLVNGTLVDANVTKGTNSFSGATTTIVNFGATGTLTLPGDGGHIPAATWNASSTLLITGVQSASNLTSNGLPFVGAPGTSGFGNITIDLPNYGSSGAFKPWKGFPNNLVIAGNLTLGRTGGLTIQTASGSNGNTLTIGGNLNVNAGNWQMNNFTTIAWTVAGNVKIDATVIYSPSTGYSAPNLITSSSSNATTLTVNGNLTMVSGANHAALSQSAGTTTVIFNGTTPQTATFDTATTTATIGYQVSNPAGVTLGSTLAGGAFALSSGNLAIAGHSLIINGVVSGTGTFTGSSTSKLTINGTAGTLNFTGGSNILDTLSIGSSGSATLGSALSIASTGGVNVANGGTLATGGLLTLLSDANGTASVGQNTVSSSYITGNVTVQRYIPANSQRAWRLLSVPTQTTQSINASWQEGYSLDVTGITGYGTIITAPSSNVAWQTEGFDTVQNSGSMLSYDAAGNAWNPVTSTNSNIKTTSGYFLYIRGDRTQLPSAGTSATTQTILRTTGPLYEGTQTAISVPAGQFGLIGNTYASTIDFTGLTLTGGLDHTFYVWDPKLYSALLGGYQTFARSNNWAPVPGGGSYTGASNTVVESGQAFFVHATGSTGSVALNEGSKVSGSSDVFRPAAPASASGKLTTNLYKNNSLVDQNVAVFNSDYSDAVDGDDALKLPNTMENLALKRDNQVLVIEARQPVVTTDTLYYDMWNMAQQQYKLEFMPDNLNNGLSAYLKDNYLGTQTPVSLSAVTDITFNVTANAASAASNRFSLVFSASSALPVTFTGINAQQQSNGSVTVSWKVASATGISQYAVEYSTDGTHFNTVGTVSSKGDGSAAYSFAGANAAAGTNYYRVEAVGAAGNSYSSIANLSANASSVAGITVYPNPVSDGHVNIRFNNLAAGVYTAKLLNIGGQEISEASLTNGGSNASAGMDIPSSLAAGTYKLEVLKADGTIYTTEVIIN